MKMNRLLLMALLSAGAAVPAAAAIVDLFAFPNPANVGSQTVSIRYTLSADDEIRLRVYSLLGTLVKESTLASGAAGGSAGLNTVTWNGRNVNGDFVAPGVYVIVVRGTSDVSTFRIGVHR